jgi:hypothetical protein
VKLFRLALVGFLVATACAAQNEPITAISLLEKIDRAGAQSVVNELSAGDESGWEFVMRKIEAGSTDWLNVAGRLSAGTDAGTSESLQIALATALPKNPAGVLRLIDRQSFLSVDHVCAAPFIEPELSYMKSYLSEAKAALIPMQGADVENIKTKCLSELNAVKPY